MNKAQETAREIRDWITAHEGETAPQGTGNALANKLGNQLAQISDAHGKLIDLRRRSTVNTLTSVVSALDETLDLSEIESMVQQGAKGDDIRRALIDKLSAGS